MSIKTPVWPSNPRILEVNTWIRLNYLSKESQREITLQNMPESIIDRGLKGFDAIWTMGVWKRSPKGREIALNHPDLLHEYKEVSNDFKPEDVVGSPYAVYDYEVEPSMGGNSGLKSFREQLNERDLLLILDYVPNHVAIDHAWTITNPNVFIKGTEEELRALPHDYFKVEDNIYANGRDPYFLPWTDTAQINAFSQEARNIATKTLLSIAELCDGVRCDMAMLLINDVFSKTWKNKVKTPLKEEFWKEVIPAVKKEFPNFKFLAEVYWNLEWTLMQQGFDYCYDKTLYERMSHDNAKSISTHLRAELDYQRKLVRFIENHDEKRAISLFGQNRSKAAAVLAFTLPGARLIHEGQTRGRKIKIPVQLGRGPEEGDNKEIMQFYGALLNSAPGRELNNANWTLNRVEPIGADFSYNNIISHTWWKDDNYLTTVVNFSPYMAKANIRIDSINYSFDNWLFKDLLNNKTYKYKGADLTRFGLYVELTEWNSHIFKIEKET